MKRINATLWVVIILSMGFVLWKSITGGLIYKMSVAERLDGPAKSDGSYVYENKTSQYKITIPDNWNISEAASDNVFESRAEITPPDEMVKVTGIYIDVLKDGVEAEALSTQPEFDKWDQIETDKESNGTTKIGEVDIGGQNMLILADLTKQGESTEDSWSVLGWTRKNGRNFYVRMFGRQQFENADEEVFKYLVSTMELI